MIGLSKALHDLVGEELALPVDPRVRDLAQLVAARHPGSRAVLFYGSCLRESQLDGLMLDFYLVVADYGAAFGRRWLAIANRLLPPNVFPIEANGLAAKYAVLSEADFVRLNRPEAESVSVWARFAQPSRLVWLADDDAWNALIEAIVQAPITFFRLALPLTDGMEPSPLDIWRRGFALTYGAELRAERSDRSSSIVDTDPVRYQRFGQAALAVIAEEQPSTREAAALRWRSLARNGKVLTLARLAKASLTFAGGIDYLAWKINRHAGANVIIRPWQRRHPIVGALTLLPRLFRRGSIR